MSSPVPSLSPRSIPLPLPTAGGTLFGAQAEVRREPREPLGTLAALQALPVDVRDIWVETVEDPDVLWRVVRYADLRGVEIAGWRIRSWVPCEAISQLDENGVEVAP